MEEENIVLEEKQCCSNCRYYSVIESNTTCCRFPRAIFINNKNYKCGEYLKVEKTEVEKE